VGKRDSSGVDRGEEVITALKAKNTNHRKEDETRRYWKCLSNQASKPFGALPTSS
jgi:hypothetical protein